MAIQYDKPRIRLIFRLRLGKIDLSEPLDCDVVVCPAVVGRDVIPIGHLPELIDKPLLLKLFAFEYNPRFQKTASCSRGFDKASPSTGLRALEEGLPPGVATANNQGIQAYVPNGLAHSTARTTDSHQIRP